MNSSDPRSYATCEAERKLGAGFAAIIVGTWGALIGFALGWVVFK